MEFALAVNYLYYVWSMSFYTVPKAPGKHGDTLGWAARQSLSYKESKQWRFSDDS